jgi:deazaflavin-dependent oxidoreductase (nitroreductase family)
MVRIAVIVLIALVLFWFVAVPIFERIAPPHVVRTYQRLAMPLFRASAGVTPGFGLVETTGRRSGLPRVTPIGGRLSGKTFWFVAGIGRGTQYVRNIEANPRVRVKVLGKWRTGTARLCEEDDAQRRMFWVNPANGFFLLLVGGERLTVRVDLDG